MAMQHPWLALIACTLYSKENLLAAVEGGATAVIFYDPEQDHQDVDKDRCSTLLPDIEETIMPEHTSRSVVLSLDSSTSKRLAAVLDRLEDASVAMASVRMIDITTQDTTSGKLTPQADRSADSAGVSAMKMHSSSHQGTRHRHVGSLADSLKSGDRKSVV